MAALWDLRSRVGASGRRLTSGIETIGRQAAGGETIQGLTHAFERG